MKFLNCRTLTERRWQIGRLRLQRQPTSFRGNSETGAEQNTTTADSKPGYKASHKKLDYPKKFKSGDRVAVYFRESEHADGGREYLGTITHVGSNPEVLSYQFSSRSVGSSGPYEWHDFESSANKFLSRFPS